jgi:ComF family protein
MLSWRIARFKRHLVNARRTTRWLGRAAGPVVAFCYPRECASCGFPFEAAQAEDSELCGACALALEQIAAAPACGRCAMPAAAVGTPCPHCLGRSVPPFERVASLGVLRHPLQRLVHRAKYAGRWRLAEMLVERAMRRGDVRQLMEHVDVVVPVPMYRWRQVLRGYNQAEVIGQHLARLGGKRFCRVAVRAQSTAVQAQLHARAKRFENLRNAFVLDRPAAIAGKRVLVVDDVLTTGATLVAMGRTLTAAEPAKLFGMVLAVADPKGRAFEVI